MSSLSLRYAIGSFFRRFFPTEESEEIDNLKGEIRRLREELQTLKVMDINAVKREIEFVRSELEGNADKDANKIKQEIDILRDEMLENVAAVHRLEILTLERRLTLLNQFGKALPPTYPGRTRKSAKKHGYSFGIITNGKRNEKLLRLLDTIRMQDLTDDSYEILIAGCVDEIARYDDVRTFPMERAAAEGRLGAMRNVLSKNALFNKFVCLDDDFLLHPKWSNAVEEIHGDFDIATGIIVNPDLTRYCDWVNLIENYTFLRAYHETFDKCQYMTGGYGIYKDFIFEDHSWDDHLGFYQGEDVSFSRRLFNAGYQLKFIPRAIVMHDDERYTQKGYGVIRQSTAERTPETSDFCLRMEKLCPRSLS